MKLEERLYNGDRAREVLENEVFQQVLADMEHEVIEQWKQSTNPADRERLHQYHTLLQKVRTRLLTTLETGKLARLELQDKQKVLDRVRSAMPSWLG